MAVALCGTGAFAAVTEGEPGKTYEGEYAVIVNTSITDAAGTGTLVFDSAAGTGSAKSASAQTDDMVQPEQGAAQRSSQTAAVSYTVGTEKYIYYGSGASGKTYVCIGVGEHCYVWMEKNLKAQYDAAGKTAAIAKDMAGTYDGKPYQVLSGMCADRIPYRDNSGKLSILLEILNGSSGMYASDVGITAIHINTPEAASYTSGDMSSRNGLLVHEG